MLLPPSQINLAKPPDYSVVLKISSAKAPYNSSHNGPANPMSVGNSQMIYAQGSHRSLVLVNGGIGNNTIQKELEEKLWMTNPATNF